MQLYWSDRKTNHYIWHFTISFFDQNYFMTMGMNEVCNLNQVSVILSTGRNLPADRHPLGRRNPRQTPSPPEMATAEEGTHPTGMHSCFIKKFASSRGQLVYQELGKASEYVTGCPIVLGFQVQTPFLAEFIILFTTKQYKNANFV